MPDEQQRPEPLSSPECNLRGLEWMPLDVITLPDSDLALKSDGDAFKAAVMLWCKSWRQVPAGSLPNDDESLATLSQVKGGLKAWRKVKEMALRGWVECADGRLYHPVLAAKAMEALPHRQQFSEKKKSEKDRKDKERADRTAMFQTLRDAGIVLPYDTKTTDLRARVAALSANEAGLPAAAAQVPTAPPAVVQPVTTPVTPPVTANVTARTGHDLTRPDQPLSLSVVASTPTSAPAAPASPSAPRALRKCPATFEVTADMVAWANEHLPAITPARLQLETDKFRDHTFTNAKTDWASTWRNWMRRVAEKLAEAARPLNGHRPLSAAAQVVADHLPGIAAGNAPPRRASFANFDQEATDAVPKLSRS